MFFNGFHQSVKYIPSWPAPWLKFTRQPDLWRLTGCQLRSNREIHFPREIFTDLLPPWSSAIWQGVPCTTRSLGNNNDYHGQIDHVSVRHGAWSSKYAGYVEFLGAINPSFAPPPPNDQAEKLLPKRQLRLANAKSVKARWVGSSQGHLKWWWKAREVSPQNPWNIQV